MMRHFTTTVYVFDELCRVLHVWLRKFQKWMSPGGHIDENELPEDAAVRECKEETGLDVEIVKEESIDLFARTLNEGQI